MYEQQDDSSWSFAIGLFIGATVGAALASLFSPRSGQQNREVVREQGLVLRSRVSNATSSAATNVRDTRDIVVARVSDTASSVKEKASSAAGTVSETASSAVETVSETASSAVAKVQDVASSAAARVSETAATVKEKASSAVETVSETASSAAAKVQDVASSAAARVSETASSATEKARALTQGSAGSASDEIVIGSVGKLATEASYDAEDARPATSRSVASDDLASDIASVNPRPASADRTIDTSGLGGDSGLADGTSTTGSSALAEGDLGTTSLAELGASDAPIVRDPDALGPIDLSDTVALAPSNLDESGLAVAADSDALAADDAAEPLIPEQIASTDALAELASDEQFEVDASTAAGTDVDVREASEGADRSG